MAALCGRMVMPMAMAAVLLAASFVSVDAVKSRRQAGNEKQNNFFRRAASGVSRNLAAVFGEENVQAVQKFFSRITEQFVFGMDVLLQTIWKIWMDLLDIFGIDGSNVSQYLNPTTAVTHPTQVLLLVVAVLVAYWFLSMFIGLIFYTLRITCGGCFWIARIVFFALACLYILQKSEGDPEGAVLPLCFVVLTYIMTGPVGFYWRRNTSHVEEKLEHLDGQIRLMNIRLNRVLEKLDQNAG